MHMYTILVIYFDFTESWVNFDFITSSIIKHYCSVNVAEIKSGKSKMYSNFKGKQEKAYKM